MQLQCHVMSVCINLFQEGPRGCQRTYLNKHEKKNKIIPIKSIGIIKSIVGYITKMWKMGEYFCKGMAFYLFYFYLFANSNS